MAKQHQRRVGAAGAMHKRHSVGMRAEASLDSPLARLGAWISDRPRAVLAAFALLLAIAAVYGASAAEHLPAGGFEVPGSESDLAVKEAESHFGIGSADVLALYRDPRADVRNVHFGSWILDLTGGLLATPGVVGTSSYFDRADSDLAAPEGPEALVMVSLAGTTADKLRTLPLIESQLRDVQAPIEVSIGGHVAASLAAQRIATADIAAAEKIALPIAAVLTLLFFRGVVAALLPIAIGAFALASSAAIVRFGSNFTEIAIFALNVAAFLGLGLSIDYSLLMVQRFREELARGHSPRVAVITALDTAGRAVFVSGLAVMVSLIVLLGVPVAILRSVLPDARIFPSGSEVRRVDEALADAGRFDPGGASAMQVVVETAGAPLEPRNLRLLRAYAARVAAVDGVKVMRTPFDTLDPDALSREALASAAAAEPVATRLARMTHADRSLLVATGANSWRSAAAAEALEAVRGVPHSGLDVKIGGATAQMVDLKLTLREYGRVAAVLVIAWNFVMLLFAFRSVLVPIKAILMNVLSLGASYGLLVWVVQDGHFSKLLGFEPLDGMDPSIPLRMFSVGFGLSRHY